MLRPFASLMSIGVLGLCAPLCAQEPETAPGLVARWTTNARHATLLGHVDWSAPDHVTIVDDVNWPTGSAALYHGGPIDNFALQLVGRLNIPETGAWTLDLRSDAGARLFIDGALVIDDDASHSYRLTTATVSLAEGEHDFELHYLERTGTHGLTLEWSSATVPTAIVPKSAFSHVVVDEDAHTEPGGLRAYWLPDLPYLSDLDAIDWTNYGWIGRVDNLTWGAGRDLFDESGAVNQFGARFEGTIIVPESGTWTFRLFSDDGSRLTIDDQIVIDHDGAHSPSWKSGSTALAAGEHDIQVIYFERTGDEALFLTWQGPSDAWEKAVPSSALRPAPLEPPSSTEGGGLDAYWYFTDSSVNDLGDIDWSTYDHTTTESGIAWANMSSAFYPGGPTNYFALRLLGQVEVPETGNWTFNLGSDDGSRLIIDGDTVVDHDGLHGLNWRSGSKLLTAGSHDIEVYFFERSGNQALQVTWQGPSDTVAAAIPSVAFTPASPGAEGSLRAYWTTDASYATSLGEVDFATWDLVTNVADVNWASTTSAFYVDGPTDDFAMRLVGHVDVPATDTWTFDLESDEGARLFIDGQLVVDHDASHSFQSRTGSIALVAGTHDLEVRYIERSGAQGLRLSWSSSSQSQVVIPSSRFSVDTDEVPLDPASGGLRAYWTANTRHATTLGQVDWLGYDRASIEERVNWPPTSDAFITDGPVDDFAVRLLGTIDIPEAGGWTFKLGSEGAARLLIDDDLVVDDDTEHGFRFRAGAAVLLPGAHSIEVQYRTGTGDQGLMLTWRGPSDAFESIVPSSALTPAQLEAPGGPGGDGLSTRWYESLVAVYSLDDMDWSAPDATTDENNLSWRLTTYPFARDRATDSFAATLTGTLRVPRTGSWTFGLGSDAGARLSIDGSLVVDDDADHAFRFNSGTVSLGAGSHSFSVQYLERTGDQGLVLTWLGPGDAYPSVIPASAFNGNDTPRLVRWREREPGAAAGP